MQKNNFLNTNIKSGHSRVFLSGIFNARSYQVGKTLLHKRQLRGRSRVTGLGDDGLCFYNDNNSRVEDPESASRTRASSGISPFIS